MYKSFDCVSWQIIKSTFICSVLKVYPLIMNQNIDEKVLVGLIKYTDLTYQTWYIAQKVYAPPPK